MNKKKIAPHFELEGIDESGHPATYTLDKLLSDGKYLVLYIYPKDDTPGCILEAKNFKAHLPELKKMANVVGLSPDSIESHQNFREKYGLNYPLLCDPEKKTIDAYTKLGEESVFDKVVWGVIRSTFIISPQKEIVKSWLYVSVEGHVKAVLNQLKKISEQKD